MKGGECVKVDILRGKMVEKRMTYKDCSRYLNITTTTFSKKMNGQSKFTIDEACKLSNFLKLSIDERCLIFLS